MGKATPRLSYSPAVPYAFIVPVLAEVARGVGYALALHGSMTNDLDLVAVPWTDDAGTPEDLVDALGAAIRWTREGDAFGPERKPHGRIAWKIPLLAGASIDLSVMPRTSVEERQFPLQAPGYRYTGGPTPRQIPWSLAEKAYAVYSARYGQSQTLERLAERGGFGPEEMDEYHPAWREEVDAHKERP